MKTPLSPRPRGPVSKPVIGWREWVALPRLGVGRIKVKVDTGARSSSIHVTDIQTYTRAGKRFARFCIHPLQRNSRSAVETHAEIIAQRTVRDSGGKQHLRYFIQTDVELMGERFPIVLSLASRDVMGFRMLLGRQAVRRRFLVDPLSLIHISEPTRPY